MVSAEVAQTVNNFTQHMLLSDSELGSVFQNTELPGLYMDPVLQNDPSKYAEFVALMFKCHLVRFDLLARSSCGLFFFYQKAQGW